MVEADVLVEISNKPRASPTAIDAPNAASSQLAFPALCAKIGGGGNASEDWSRADAIEISDRTAGAAGVTTAEAPGATSLAASL
jgi:hypothetical protein